jgi:anaerobic selenocysteine-containing dehydrogenase
VLSTPNGKALEAALPGLDFRVAVDVYINETTRFADLILPPASSLSQPNYDLLFNAFAVRRVARWSAPLREMHSHERADWQILDGLGRTYATASGRDYTAMPPPHVILEGGLKRGNSGLDFPTLRDAEHGIDLGPLRPCLLERLQTASGMIECAPPLFVQDLQRLRESLHDATANGALQLIGRRDIRSNNSWMHNAPRLVKGKPRHHLWMHPEDLAARGLADGARVRMRSRVGSIDVDVQAHDAVMRGVACLPHGFGHARHGVQLDRARNVTGESYNDLSDPLALDAPSGNAALNGLEVWVEAIA